MPDPITDQRAMLAGQFPYQRNGGDGAARLAAILLASLRAHCGTAPGTPPEPTEQQTLECITALASVTSVVVGASDDPARERWRFETLLAAQIEGER